jgi:hypothetical protein
MQNVESRSAGPAPILPLRFDSHHSSLRDLHFYFRKYGTSAYKKRLHL